MLEQSSALTASEQRWNPRERESKHTRNVQLDERSHIQIVITRVVQKVMTQEITEEHVVDHIAHVKQVYVALITWSFIYANLLRFALHRLE